MKEGLHTTKDEIRTAAKRKRVLVVDQFPVARQALSEWINRTPDLTLCGAAHTKAGALTAVTQLKPDVVVTEILDQQDLSLIRSLHRRHPRLPILVFSFRDEGWYAPRALEAGADGYLMKGVSIDGLVDGIRGTLEGRVVLSPRIRAQLLRKCFGGRRVSRQRRGHRCDRSLVEKSGTPMRLENLGQARAR
jgi:DNA-binding NarL/FixJ family response regulator